MNPLASVVLLTLVTVIHSREISQKLLREISSLSDNEMQGDSRFNFLTGENSFGLLNSPLSLAIPRRELIDFGVQQQPPGSVSVSQDKPCATVLTTSNCVIQVPEDALHKNIAERQFTLAFGLIKEQCSLTIRDCSGSYFTASNFLHGSICSTAVSVCCECNGCNRPSTELISDYNGDTESTTCAVLFEHERCSLCYGFRLQVGDGDKTLKMNDLVDNKVSSIYVMAGCELIIYQDRDFQGLAALAQGSLDYLPPEWNDVISSFQCSCNTEGGRSSTPAQPTPSPPPPVTPIPVETLTTSTTIGNSEVLTTSTTKLVTMGTIKSTTSAPSETEAPASTTNTPSDTPTTPEPTTSTTTEEIYNPLY